MKGLFIIGCLLFCHNWSIYAQEIQAPVEKIIHSYEELPVLLVPGNDLRESFVKKAQQEIANLNNTYQAYSDMPAGSKERELAGEKILEQASQINKLLEENGVRVIDGSEYIYDQTSYLQQLEILENRYAEVINSFKKQYEKAQGKKNEDRKRRYKYLYTRANTSFRSLQSKVDEYEALIDESIDLAHDKGRLFLIPGTRLHEIDLQMAKVDQQIAKICNDIDTMM